MEASGYLLIIHFNRIVLPFLGSRISVDPIVFLFVEILSCLGLNFAAPWKAGPHRRDSRVPRYSEGCPEWLWLWLKLYNVIYPSVILLSSVPKLSLCPCFISTIGRFLGSSHWSPRSSHCRMEMAQTRQAEGLCPNLLEKKIIPIIPIMIKLTLFGCSFL